MSVYFITAREVGRVKIGCASDPWHRLEKLKTSSPCDLRLEAIAQGSFAEERRLHHRFADHRLRGEWFALTAEIEALIAASPPPVRGFEGKRRSQRRKLQHNIADNETIAAKRLRDREMETERLVEESIALERKMLAEAMADFAKLDLPTPEEMAA